MLTVGLIVAAPAPKAGSEQGGRVGQRLVRLSSAFAVALAVVASVAVGGGSRATTRGPVAGHEASCSADDTTCRHLWWDSPTFSARSRDGAVHAFDPPAGTSELSRRPILLLAAAIFVVVSLSRMAGPAGRPRPAY